jgi:hypothetical protein
MVILGILNLRIWLVGQKISLADYIAAIVARSNTGRHGDMATTIMLTHSRLYAGRKSFAGSSRIPPTLGKESEP